jgi:hypothetical protein
MYIDDSSNRPPTVTAKPRSRKVTPAASAAALSDMPPKQAFSKTLDHDGKEQPPPPPVQVEEGFSLVGIESSAAEKLLDLPLMKDVPEADIGNTPLGRLKAALQKCAGGESLDVTDNAILSRAGAVVNGANTRSLLREAAAHEMQPLHAKAREFTAEVAKLGIATTKPIIFAK